MKTSKWMTLAAVLTLTSSLAMAAPHGARTGRHARGGARIAAKLNLTDAQKAQVKEIRQNSREANKAFHETARQTFRELRAARKANDTASVERLRPIVAQQRAQLRQLRQAERQQFLSILTAEQKEQLGQMKNQRRGRR
ncbi:MAG: Spy/CpxP family protein refolding chaperone [Thermoanaerobaculia bacterium]